MSIDLTTFGVQPSGFVKLRMDQSMTDIFDSLDTQWQVTVDRNPNTSFVAGLVYIVAERFAALYEVGEGVYNAMYPSTASNTSLDKAVGYVGVTRLSAAYSTAWQTFFGGEGASVPLGTQVQNAQSGDAYQTTAALTITAAACNYIVLTASSVGAGQYTVTIDGSEFSYTATASDTVTTIMSGLGEQLQKYGLTVVTDGASVTLSTTVETVHNIQFSSNLAAQSIGSPTVVTALAVGPLSGNAGDLSELDSTLGNVTGTTNTAAVASGRYAENDAELRARHASGPYVLGAASLNAIYSNMANCPGVTSCRILVNATDAADANGVPANSVAAVVVGGSDSNVASTLLGVVAAGIPTFGSTAVVVSDNQGNPVTVNFTRPTPLYIWVNVTVTFFTSETFPVNGDSLITAAVIAYGNNLSSGVDIIIQRFCGAIFSTVSGLATITITMASSTDPTSAPESSAYTSDSVPVTAFQQPVFDSGRVNVVA